MGFGRATGSSGIAGCGPWGGVVLGLRAEEAFFKRTCGPHVNLALTTASQRGFNPHRFAGRVGLERRSDAGNSEVGVGNSDSEFRTLIQSSAKRRFSLAFREETGHEIDWRGVVRTRGRYGQRICGPASLWHRPERARDSLRDRSMRAIGGVGLHLARATMFRSSSCAGHRVSVFLLCGPDELPGTNHEMRAFADFDPRLCGPITSCGIKGCWPSWRLRFGLAGREPVWLCRLWADETFGRYSCGP